MFGLTDEQIARYKDRKVILVDEKDNVLGETDLISAHRDGGKKHRAFSLILYRKSEVGIEVLLQRRALVKPVFSGYWANTCCYNMAPGEEMFARARSRVNEELGVYLGDQPLSELYRFSYEAEGENGWWENEVDHVIIGEIRKQDTVISQGKLQFNPDEVMDYRWVEWGEMKEWMEKEPVLFAPWWRMIVEEGRVEKYLSE